MDNNKYIKERLENAIQIMKDACFSAERYLTLYRDKPHRQPQLVMHCLTWGLANASSSIECAMERIVEMKEIADIEIKGLKDNINKGT